MASHATESAQTVDTLASLEQRITRAVQIIGELRTENEDLRGKLAKAEEQRQEAQAFSEAFQKEHAELEQRAKHLTQELESLREERKQVKNRIEKLLSQLDLLSAT
jgi:chromosome segregation ATPase